ncbi:MAG: hypothetical protein SCK28_09420 [Bacillota bacterium]|nr:hypothetical protein [Bacillota bacterium]
MEYLVTWIEGEEVQYLFLNQQELQSLLDSEIDKNYIYTRVQ